MYALNEIAVQVRSLVTVQPSMSFCQAGRCLSGYMVHIPGPGSAYLRTKLVLRLRLGLAKVSGIALSCSRSGPKFAASCEFRTGVRK